MHITKNTNTVTRFVLVICIITFLPFLGETLFNTKGEPREAIVAFSMLEQGNWLLPESCGGDIPYKPPFLAWLIAVIASVTGSVSEYISRLPSALALIAMTIIGCRFYANRSSAIKALFMALVFITAFEVERAGMTCRVDMVLTACLVSAMYSLYRYFEHDCKGIPIAAILLMSCAVLTKGPVGMVLPCLVIGIFRLIIGDRFIPTLLRLTLIGTASLIIPALWYIAAHNHGGDEFISLVIEENFDRFTGSMDYSSHEKPIYYNFLTVIAGYTPYTLLALLSLFAIGRRHISKTGIWQRIRGMEPHRLFALVAIVVVFVFYCIPESKRSVYLLPIYPFIAYFIAELVIYLAENRPRIINIYGSIIATLSLVVAATFAAVKFGVIPSDIFTGRHATENITMLNALSERSLGFCWIIYALSIAAAVGFFYIKTKRHPKVTFFATLITTLALYWSMFAIYQPAVLNTKSDRPIAEQIDRIAPSGSIYSFIDDQFLRFYTINFYLGDRVKLFEVEQPTEGIIIIGDRDVKVFKTRNKDVALSPIFHSDARSCDLRQTITVYRFSRQ